jgi:hypothetical protein
MDLKIDGMSGLVAWIFLAQDSKELGDFVNKFLKYSQNLFYSQNLRIQNIKYGEFVAQLTDHTFLGNSRMYIAAFFQNTGF